jgi:hypothetical protein
LKLEFVAFESKRDFALEFIAQLTFMLMYPNINHFNINSLLSKIGFTKSIFITAELNTQDI